MNESTVILTGVQINTPIYLGMKREYDFVHPMVDEFCRAAEFVPTPGEAPLHLVAGKGPFQRTVNIYGRFILVIGYYIVTGLVILSVPGGLPYT